MWIESKRSFITKVDGLNLDFHKKDRSLKSGIFQILNREYFWIVRQGIITLEIICSGNFRFPKCNSDLPSFSNVSTFSIFLSFPIWFNLGTVDPLVTVCTPNTVGTVHILFRMSNFFVIQEFLTTHSVLYSSSILSLDPRSRLSTNEKPPIST